MGLNSGAVWEDWLLLDADKRGDGGGSGGGGGGGFDGDGGKISRL